MRHRALRTALLSAALALTLPMAQAAEAVGDTQTIRCARLLDVVSGKVLADRSVEVRDGRVVAIRETPEAERASAHPASQTCVPGFIDLHTHLTMEFGPARYTEGFRLEPADFALRSTRYARVTLEAGFTTVRDLGDSDKLSISLRNAINEGTVVGPRIYTAGKSIATTGGHADPTNGVNSQLMGQPTPVDGVVNSPDAAWEAVRQRYKEGSDLIKITATGGVLSLARSGLNPQFRQEEVNAIVAAAKDYGYTVAAHAHGKEGMKRAVIAGVTSIEHGSEMDEEIFALMKQKGVWYVPTLTAGRYVAEQSKIKDFYPPMVAIKAASIGPKMQQTVRAAYAAGVKIAFGTDAGVFPHGQNAREFGYLVEAGVPPLEALRMATIHAAAVLGESDNLGSLEVGRYGDVVVLDGDPLGDIAATTRVVQVYKGGVAVR
jgi:imidazolonepropionase-like amidohydrolase